MHIQLDEAQIIWWVLGGASSSVGLILAGTWALLGRFRDDVTRQIVEANKRIEDHMEAEEGRWGLIHNEFREIRAMFVTRIELELRMKTLEDNVNVIRRTIDTRTSSRGSSKDDNSERPIHGRV